MVRTCQEGHPIADNKEACKDGHPLQAPPPAGATAEVPVSLTHEKLQEIIQGAIAGALAANHAIYRRDNQHNLKKPERPEIDLGSNEGQWAFFLNEWNEYKTRCNLSGRNATMELRATCSVALRREVFDFVGSAGLENISEDVLLVHIKTLAVKGKNKSVHRKEFYAMNQGPGQPIQAYITKLKSKAMNCNYSIKCSSAACGHHVNSYAEHMIADQMVVGCADTDIQQEVLAKDSQLPDFQARFDLIQALEEGKVAKSQLSSDATSTVAHSKYQRQKNQGLKSEVQINLKQRKQRRCSGCGSSEHGPGTNLPRAENCPAWEKICDFCNIKGHFSKVCRGKRTSPSPCLGRPPLPTPDKSAHHAYQSAPDTNDPSCFFAFDSTDTPKQDKAFAKHLLQCNKLAWQSRSKPMQRTCLDRKVIVPHMEWFDESFQPCKPKSLPKVTVDVTVLRDAHEEFNKPIPAHTWKEIKHNAPISCLADTGAQTCACGLELLDILNIDSKYLIPTSHRIVGVTQSLMDIVGVILLRIEAGGKSSNQVVYVSKNISGFFLSEKAQIDLGIIPISYPSPNSVGDGVSMAAAHDQPGIAPCGCRRRTDPPPLPDELPFAPTPENRERLQHWLLDYYASSAFNTCEHQTLPKMTGKPLDIHFRPEAKAKAFHCPIPVPHHWKQKVKADLDRDVRLGIIEPVPPGTPTIWCSKMVVVAKKDGTPRRTVDLQHLNDATYRETHHTPSPFNQASVVPPHTKKTVLDAWNGYHSLPLSPKARDATTFITEWGRYRYLSSPQGFHAAGDGYTRAFDNITVDFKRKAKCIDDSLLWDTTLEEAFWHTAEYIMLCSSHGIVFNPKKFSFGMDEVDFAGFTITETGIKPMQQILDAIKNFPTPTNITGARSWFGLINQVAYAFSMADEMAPYRELLKAGKKWFWDETLDNLFEKSKKEIIKLVEKGVRSFEVGRPTCLATDWSKDGVGFVLLQKFCTCKMDSAPNCCKEGWRLIYAGSRFTTDAESRYAPVEGEALAVVYALEKCRIFVLGCPNLTVVVDHKPLVKILGDRSLEDIKNPRLFNLKEKTLMYDFQIKHVPGKWHLGPDACSRYPASPSQDVSLSCLLQDLRHQAASLDISSSLDTNCYVESSVYAAMSGGGYTEGIDVRVITWDRVKHAASHDSETNTLIPTILSGFPETKEELPNNIQPYWNIRNDLTCLDGVALYNNRIVVPRSLRTEVLDCLHSAHQGVVGMKARARTSVYWPGINCAISSRRAQCKTCDRIGRSQPAEPMLPSPAPEYPFDQVVADYFDLAGIKYLVYADRYTGWVVVIKTPKGEADSVALKKQLRMLFGIYGAPRELSTDGGPPFCSYDVQSFLTVWGVHSRISSAYYPQSNGRAELSVKSAKRILLDNVGPHGCIDNDRVARALLQHRNTPLQEIGLSPAQLLYGRTLRDCIPTMAEANKVRPEWRMVADDRERALAKRNIINIERYNQHTRSLPELHVGDAVAVQNQTGPRPNKWEKTGVIVEKLDHRQYVVRMDGSGRCTLRNRRFLKTIQPVCADMPLAKIPTPPVHQPAQPQTPVGAPLMNITPERHEQLVDVHPRRITFDTPLKPGISSPPPIVPDFPEIPSLPAFPAYDAVHVDTPCRSPMQQSHDHKDSPQVVTAMPVRRSTRERRPRRDLSPQLTGKSHKFIDMSTSSPLADNRLKVAGEGEI